MCIKLEVYNIDNEITSIYNIKSNSVKFIYLNNGINITIYTPLYNLKKSIPVYNKKSYIISLVNNELDIKSINSISDTNVSGNLSVCGTSNLCGPANLYGPTNLYKNLSVCGNISLNNGCPISLFTTGYVTLNFSGIYTLSINSSYLLIGNMAFLFIPQLEFNAGTNPNQLILYCSFDNNKLIPIHSSSVSVSVLFNIYNSIFTYTATIDKNTNIINISPLYQPGFQFYENIVIYGFTISWLVNC